MGIIVVNPNSSFNREPFDSWFARVERELVKLCGMGPDMLPDWRYREDYEARVTPARCAKRALRHAREAV